MINKRLLMLHHKLLIRLNQQCKLNKMLFQLLSKQLHRLLLKLLRMLLLLLMRMH